MTILRLGCFAASVLFSLGEMGLLTGALNRYAALLLAVVFLATSLPKDLRGVPGRRLAAGIAMVVLAGVLARGGDVWSLVAFSAFATGLAVIIGSDDAKTGEIALFAPTAVLFMFFHLIYRYVPDAWWLANAGAIAFSHSVGSTIGQAYAFGATAGGLHVMALFAAWGLARLIWKRSGRWWHFPVFLLALIVATGVTQMLLTVLAIAVQLWIPELDFLLFNAQVLYLALALVPAAWYYRKVPVGERVAALNLRPALTVLIVAAGVLLGVGLGLAPNEGTGGGKVLLLDKGYLDWSTPDFGRYGGRSGGMFGRLPHLLEAQGYDVERATGLLSAEALAGARALVIINLMDPLEQVEKQAIWDWVSTGGSLVVLGDHTGVMGIREPFNDLLKPVDIEFKFDSATYWGQSWRDALEVMPHPITGDLEVAEDVQIWIGASLGLAPPARPVITAKYGYSDIGDEQNFDRSYLGDRRHNPGEQVGDLCLVADAGHGKGRVLVFGDTSSIQNGALVMSWAFVQRMFQWLTSPAASSPGALRLALAAAGLVCLVVAARSLRRSAASWLILALALVAAMEVADRLTAPPAPPRIGAPKAVIDISHGERFDQLSWYDDCIGGFDLNLMRNGYNPLLMREFSAGLVLDSELLVVIAPARRFGTAELDLLREFVEAGGVLIVSTGYEEKDGSESLLALFGVELENIPLAHFEVEVFGETAHFAEAWPLKVSGPLATVVAAYPGLADPVAVFVPRGEGGALILGDSQFFLNINLEGRDEWHLGNIMFLRELLGRIQAGGLTG
jgi:hypothetical protein